jgi:glutamate formiminotransferase / 5-formyltetrahydrofolate cyclo-ligase
LAAPSGRVRPSLIAAAGVLEFRLVVRSSVHTPRRLLAVPNVSAARDQDAVVAVGAALAPASNWSPHLLDVHIDPDHGRSVFTVAGFQREIAAALVRGAQAAIERIDLSEQSGVHPRVGALDVAPVVYPVPEARGAAIAEALTAAALIGEDLGLPVFLYGDLATAPDRVERASLRDGGPGRLAERIRAAELRPDYGPADLDASTGATLVTARPPLVAFNLELESHDLELARGVAAAVRESGGGLPGVRALGVWLNERGCAQVTMNVHDPFAVPLRDVVAAVRAHAPVAYAELVGLAPKAAFEGFPDDVPLRGFDPERHLLENALRSLPDHGQDQGEASAQAPRDAGGHGRPPG